jgi:hypothetical protein
MVEIETNMRRISRPISRSGRCIRRLTSPAEIAEMAALAEKDLWLSRRQSRHQVGVADRGARAGELGAIIAINLSSAFYGSRAAVASIKRRGWTAARDHGLLLSTWRC